MLVLSRKHNGINIIDCWYAKQPLHQEGMIRYYEAQIPIGETAAPFQTLMTDLTEEEEAISSHFSKNCRYEVRRAPREGVTCSYKAGTDITEEDIIAYTDFFEEFWRSKGVDYTEKEKCRAEIRQYAAADAYVIAAASLGDKLLVYHTYIVDEEKTRLYQSASQFRADESVATNVIGYANRYLHYQDMLYFKQHGQQLYDWGGAGTNEEVESITRFKESFGGEPVTLYNGEETRGISAGMYKKLTGLIGRVTK